MQESANERENSGTILEKDEKMLEFLDSIDSYLVLMDSLSSRLRQGWMELASARHSMGASRVNSSLFDLKSHHASTTLRVNDNPELPQFTLCKWASSDNPLDYPEEACLDQNKVSQSKSTSSQLEDQELQEKRTEKDGSPVTTDNQAQIERSKTLSMFGTLVSPKLRAAQLSFETALETLLEISNKRALLLYSFDQVRGAKETTTN